ncbi:hypothetical protein QEV61_04630 [Trueperella pyogenes]|uniref:hypothetical protein n=1 Tax=Trueperella pyogenes TaxID=1661 RepID=UPI003250DDC1
MENKTADISNEYETTVNMTDADNLVRIWTCQRTVLKRLRRKPDKFTETKHGYYTNANGTRYEWAEFTIPTKDFNLANAAINRRPLTEAQRAELSERARRALHGGDAA